jgi:hypothetical protein
MIARGTKGEQHNGRAAVCASTGPGASYRTFDYGKTWER